MSQKVNPQLFPDVVIRTGHGSVTCMTFLPPADADKHCFLLAGTDCGGLAVWNLRTQTIKQTVRAEGDDSSLLSVDTVSSVEGAMGGAVGVVSYSRSQVVRFYWWDEATRVLSSTAACEVKLSAFCPSFCQLTCLQAADGDCLIAAPSDKTVEFLQLTRREDNSAAIIPWPARLEGERKAMVTCMSFHAGADKPTTDLLIGSEAGDVALYGSDSRGCEDFALLSCLNTHGTDPVLSLHFLPKHRLGCSVGAGSGDIVLWKREDDSLKHHLTITTPSTGFNRVSLRSDCKLVVSCGWDKVVRLHGPKKGVLLGLLDFHRDSVNAVLFDNDFSFLTASKDGTLCTWNLYSRNKT